MKVIRSKEYYRQLWPILKAEKREMDQHTTQAAAYKKIYALTQGRKGVCGLVNRFAFKMNQKHITLLWRLESAKW